MKNIFEALLVLAGAVVLLFSLYHVDFWGMLLGAGLVFAPLTAGGMLLMYLALVGIPFGLGVALGAAAKQVFGPGIMVGVGFVGGIFIGGKFVLSDTFDKMFSKKPSPEPAVPPSNNDIRGRRQLTKPLDDCSRYPCALIPALPARICASTSGAYSNES